MHSTVGSCGSGLLLACVIYLGETFDICFSMCMKQDNYYFYQKGLFVQKFEHMWDCSCALLLN